MSGWSGGPKQTKVTPRDLGRALAGFKSALGEDLSAARDWFVGNMQRASGGGILNEGETDTSARAGAGMSLAGAAMTGAAPGGVFAAPRGALGAGPIRAYHGSPHDFDKFDISRAGSTTDPGSLGRGVYLSTDERVATPYPRKYEADVNLKNPLSISVSDLGENKSNAVFRALGIDDFAKMFRSLTPEQSDLITKELRAKGHDGVVLDYSPSGYNAKEVMALDPNVIEILRKYGMIPAVSAPLLGAALDQYKPGQAEQ